MAVTYITMGDPRGVGPEVALKALAAEESPRPVRLVGVREVFARAALVLGVEPLFRWLEEGLLDVATPAERTPGGDLARCAAAEGSHPFGALSAALAGEWAGRAIEAAVRTLRPEEGDALVTAPIDKAALQAGGYSYPGHTEMLGALAGAPSLAMMLVAEGLRVSLVTGHVPLREVASQLRAERIREVFLLTHHAMRMGWEIPEPRIAVCGLNPHAGEGGLLGDEEEKTVSPAVRELAADGFLAAGPLPADTVFPRVLAGEFDAVVALYHDQGLIPVKLHGFGRGVNVTLGLPFVRTSPDHGTARDIAGSGQARSDSFVAALALARSLAARAEFVRAPVYKAARAV